MQCRLLSPLIAITIIIGAMILLGGCQKATSEELRIGVIAPLSGDAATYGNALRKGLELSLENINSSGGVQGKRIVLIFEDSQADPKIAISAFNKLVTIDKVSIIIGDMFSSTTLSIAPLAQKSRVVLLSPTASSEAVPKVGDYIFSIYPSDSYDGTFVARFVAESLKMKTAAVIYVQSDAMITAAKAFNKTFSELGGRTIVEEGIAPKTNDFRSLLIKIKTASPDVIFIPAYLDEIALLLNQARELGIGKQFVTISTAYDNKLFSLSPDSSQGLILSAPFYEEKSKMPEIISFQNAFRNKYGETPNVWSAYGYDSLNIIATAYANSITDNIPLNNSLSKIDNYNGVTGITTFVMGGSVEKQLRMLAVRGNNFEEYR